MSKATNNDVVILSAQRTAIGSFQGAFANTPAPQLGAHAIQASLKNSGLKEDQIDECIMGQVLTAGVGQAPARQAALGASLPLSVPCLTINKVCGSGLKAVMLAADAIQLGRSQAVVAGGQENMTLAPHLLEKSRPGYRMGHQQVIDSMIKDGLWDPYNDFHMGVASELCSKEYKFSREEQDEYAISSYKLAQEAISQGRLTNEIAGFEIKTRKGSVLVDTDEEPGKVKFDKIPGLRPAFDKEGTVTAANASSINDGAAAVVLSSGQRASELGATPMARIVSQATFAHDPKWFTTAPIGAMKRALEQANLSASDIDLWEVNEAFSNVAMAAIKELGFKRDQLNVHGGAVALGHPIGASGARLLTTLVHALKTHDKQYGMVSLCIGGGEAVAVIIERL